MYSFGRLCDVVIVDFTMAGRVSEDGIGASEQGAHPFLLASLSGWVKQWALPSESAVHEVDTRHVVAEAAELADPNLDSFHCHKDALLVLAD